MSKVETVYFKDPGKVNSRDALLSAKRRADELGIKDLVVASYTGETGALAAEIFKGYNLIVVAGMVGFIEPNQDRMKPEYKKAIEENGGKILRACHSFGGLGRAVNKKFNAIQVDEIIAHVLRLFGAGVKVACECACMAADAGLIRTDREVMALGGNGGGADTAVVLLPSNTHRFFDTRIREIVCKPRVWDRPQ
ncbi:MAG: pyruvate kinase alpha/beta domain-containing protein [Candidatus Bathyarchaeota archaeon]|nr:pyruvate kinase alpha/beta domain-containing protein [Candidatus Bathyarchaeota archaeon]